MQQAGWQVTGLEPDETARANAAALYGLQLQQQHHLFELPASTFDAITLWHVLEHVHDLQQYLQQFAQLLKPAGRLIIAVPNHTSYDAGFYHENWAAYDVPRHLYHFSPISMETLLEKNGFVVETMQPMWFDSYYISLLSERYKNGKGNFLRAMGVGLLANVVAFINPKKCSSLIYIIKLKQAF